MVNLRQATIDTYNQSAEALADYFRGKGPRVKYIDIALELAGNPKDAKVVEIGCGDGRDAKYIVSKVKYYVGFDISKELIRLAKEHVPGAKFEVADANNFDYPNNLNVVFAFASILHLDSEELKETLKKVSDALKTGGVFYISSKHAIQYKEQVKEDKFGTRLFYFYNPEIISELAGDKFIVKKYWYETIGHTKWFEVALQKK
jgi:SAM-dependent methyltransferase